MHPRSIWERLPRSSTLTVPLVLGTCGLLATVGYFYEINASQTKRIDNQERQLQTEKKHLNEATRQLDNRTQSLQQEQEQMAKLAEDRRDSHRAGSPKGYRTHSPFFRLSTRGDYFA
jgi:hypothetical protein